MTSQISSEDAAIDLCIVQIDMTVLRSHDIKSSALKKIIKKIPETVFSKSHTHYHATVPLCNCDRSICLTHKIQSVSMLFPTGENVTRSIKIQRTRKRPETRKKIKNKEAATSYNLVFNSNDSSASSGPTSNRGTKDTEFKRRFAQSPVSHETSQDGNSRS